MPHDCVRDHPDQELHWQLVNRSLPLNPWRDGYVARLRALLERFRAAHPGDLEGILGRGPALVDAQLPALASLIALDLEAPPSTPAAAREAAATLYRAQHLPTLLIAMSRVLEQEERDRALRKVAAEAQALAAELAALTQAWVVLNGDGLSDDEDDDLWL